MKRSSLFSVYFVGGVSREPLRHRVWGYFRHRDRAINAALQNETDIYEAGWYPFALVALVGQGMMALPKQQWWFEYQPETDTYLPIETPEWAKSLGWTGFPELDIPQTNTTNPEAPSGGKEKG